MAIDTVRNQLVTQLRGHSALSTYVSTSGNIDYGMEGIIDFQGANTKKVRVIQIEEEEGFATLGAVRVNVEYGFHVVGIFYEPNLKTAEDTGATMSKHIRHAISSDFSVSGLVHTTTINKSYYRQHPEKPVHYVIIPITCEAQVLASNR